MNTYTIGEIVAQDYRTASVFKEAGIDFCCGGKKTITDACAEKGIDPENLIEKIGEVQSIHETISHNFNEWEPGFLSDYIVNVHHRFVYNSMSELMEYTNKIAMVHGSRHPELMEVAVLFSKINEDLLQHMKKEEEIVFPAIKEMFKNGSEKAKAIVNSEISMLNSEHEFAGEAIDRISVLTDHYKIPADACNTYRVTLGLLEKFEDDLHTHVHLENNILFPKAINEAN